MPDICPITNPFTPAVPVYAEKKEDIVQLDSIVDQILVSLAKNSDEYLSLHNRSIQIHYDIQHHLSQQLDSKRLTSGSLVWTSDVLQRIASALVPLTLIAASVPLLTTAPPAAIALMTVGALMALDTVLDDPIKRQLASTLSKHSSESNEVWLKRIHTITSAITLAISIGVAVTGTNFAPIIAAISQTTLSVGKGAVEYTKNHTEAHINDLAHALTQGDNQRQMYQETSSLLSQRYFEYCRMLSDMAQSQKAANSFILST